QLMVFFQPIYSAVFPARPYNEIATLLENRENIELLIKEIERVEAETKIIIRKEKSHPKENPITDSTHSATTKRLSIFSQIGRWFKR
ncbi:MAG: hypothetical protein N2201_05565, partial [candidate division WOR-3 bacterium]|nr:hypothetical protein [candidate division WOR-3 bacterium]